MWKQTSEAANMTKDKIIQRKDWRLKTRKKRLKSKWLNTLQCALLDLLPISLGLYTQLFDPIPSTGQIDEEMMKIRNLSTMFDQLWWRAVMANNDSASPEILWNPKMPKISNTFRWGLGPWPPLPPLVSSQMNLFSCPSAAKTDPSAQGKSTAVLKNQNTGCVTVFGGSHP